MRTLAAMATLAELRSDIEALVKKQHPDAGIEHKSAAVVVHVRGLPRDVGEAAIADARRFHQGQAF